MSIPARAIVALPSIRTLEVVVEDDPPDFQQSREGGTGDPEAPPWNFLFLFPVAMFVRFAIFGLVMCFDH